MSDSVPTSRPLAAEAPSQRLLWDLPTRLFHWALALLFTGAFAVALLSSEHSQAFLVHMLLGLVLVFAILLRLIWGLVGSRPSRFTSFLFSPGELARYIRTVMAGEDQPSAGHNPGASYAIYGMLLLPLGLVLTGLLKTSGQKWAEEVHAAFAYGMVAVVGLHLLGLVWHSRRHGDGVALAMVHGRRPVAEAQAITSPQTWAGLLFLLLVGGWGLGLVTSFDPASRQVTLPLLGTRLTLGEDKAKKEPGEAVGERGRKRHDDD